MARERSSAVGSRGVNIEELKAQGFTHIYRTPSGELWGIKLVEGVPVWHRVEQSQGVPQK